MVFRFKSEASRHIDPFSNLIILFIWLEKEIKGLVYTVISLMVRHSLGKRGVTVNSGVLVQVQFTVPKLLLFKRGVETAACVSCHPGRSEV